MTPQFVRPGIGALCALAMFGTACSGSDSNSDSGSGSDRSGDSTVSTDDAEVDSTPAPTPTENGPAETEPAVTATGAPTDDGFIFASPDGDYTITFPGEPTSSLLPVALPTGQVTAEAFIYEDGTDAAYFTSVFEYAEGTTEGEPGAVLLGARDGAVTNVGGSLVDSAFVEVDGVPGVSFSFTVTGGEGSALVYFDEPRLYQSFALGAVGQSAAFTAFLDSFKFATTITTSTTTTSDTAGDS